MAEFLPPELWTQLGLGAVFLALFIYFQRHWSEERKAKDARLHAMTDGLLEAYKSVASTNTELKGAIDNNTEAVKELCRRSKNAEGT